MKVAVSPSRPMICWALRSETMKVYILGATFSYPINNCDVVSIAAKDGETVEICLEGLLRFAAYVNLRRQIKAEEQELEHFVRVLQE